MNITQESVGSTHSDFIAAGDTDSNDSDTTEELDINQQLTQLVCTLTLISLFTMAVHPYTN